VSTATRDDPQASLRMKLETPGRLDGMPFSLRITLAFSVLLVIFALLVASLGRHITHQHELEMQQRLSQGLARHIVEHWPQMAKPAQGAFDRQALKAVLNMLMVVNPAIEVYTLDENGKVREYLGEPGMVRQAQVDVDAVRRFLEGAEFPLLGSDPKSPGARKIFSAAMFPPIPGSAAPSGYLYIVLDGSARAQVAGELDAWRLWRGALWVVLAGLTLTLWVGWMTFGSLTRPLRDLATRMGRFALPGDSALLVDSSVPERGDEVAAIDHSFRKLGQRLARQARAQIAQQDAHREIMASVAHDLRTPLTALHGYLETLRRDIDRLTDLERARYLEAAVGQSDKVRRLSLQLFDLARLQSVNDIAHRERLRLDELVHDTVQKFQLGPGKVVWHGTPPTGIEVDGDIHLIERALTNLLDNAMRHAPGKRPVRVSIWHEGRHAMVVIEDDGPGLPPELHCRLRDDEPVRPPAGRPEGGFGGLGLAIVQRIAWLHQGRLHVLSPGSPGARLCLALPLAPSM